MFASLFNCDLRLKIWAVLYSKWKLSKNLVKPNASIIRVICKTLNLGFNWITHLI